MEGSIRRPGAWSPRRRRLLARLAALTSLAAASFPAVARADDKFAGGGGAFVSFTFGEELAVGWGVETSLFGLMRGSTICDDRTRAGMGAMLQLGLINVSKLRWVVAAEGGSQVDGDESVGFVGEAGVAGHVRFDNGEPSVGVHTGLLMQTPYYLTAFVRAEWLLDDYSVGHSFRFPPTFGIPDTTCVDGRPLRDESGSPVRPTEPDPSGDLDGVVSFWRRAAQSEAAAVPAFLQLAAELITHDAPEALVDRALDAAHDEIHHARACAAMASRLSGRPERPSLPDAAPRPPLRGVEGLGRLAIESWLDGCLNEGAAAARAFFAAEHATDVVARSTAAAIARDEARHAELGWSVMTWAIERGGEVVREQLRAGREALVAPDEHACEGGLRFGAPSPDASNEIGLATSLAARRRLDRLLAAR